MKKRGVVNNTLLVLALAGAAAASHYLTRLTVETPTAVAGEQAKENKPLYWVAPMDPNYRRDKPGKSPMGMDLVPVYADQGAGHADSPGAVAIAPEVINSLGVRTALAERRVMRTEITTVGYVRYDQERLIHVHPRVQGWVEKLYVKAAGDPVKKGQPLYTLYSPQLVNAQEELVLAVRRGDTRLITAAEHRLAALRVERSLIDALKRGQTIRQVLTFHAPQSGVVDKLNIREGFFVEPGTTLMSIGALDDVWVEAEVFERQAALVSTGLPAVMTLDYLPGQRWQGTVDYVYPALDPKTRTARVRLRFANPDALLKPNMFATIAIQANAEDDVLAIPKEAVIRTGARDRVVLALGEGRFKSVAVELGRLNAEYAAIQSGLKAGERVVISAQFLLDSESSKTSDFRRMDHAGGDTAATPPQSVWVAASINAVMAAERMINADHDAIEAWSWPPMRMDFKVAEGVDIAALASGMSLHIEISRIAGGDYAITAAHIPPVEADTATGADPVDHGGMDHGGMDHGNMGHDAMQHGAMNHDGMGHDGAGHDDHGRMDHGNMRHDAMQHGAMNHDGMGHDDAGHDNHGGMDHSRMSPVGHDGHGHGGHSAPETAPDHD